MKLHEMLETKDRKEQEKIVENLIRIAQADVSGINIVVRGDEVKYGMVGKPRSLD